MELKESPLYIWPSANNIDENFPEYFLCDYAYPTILIACTSLLEYLQSLLTPWVRNNLRKQISDMYVFL